MKLLLLQGQLARFRLDAPPKNAEKTLKAPKGYKVELFALEKEFPNLANPVRLSFDNKGSLWVACMPSYPHWKVGDAKPSDTILILEDTDGDGKADTETVFAGDLHLKGNKHNGAMIPFAGLLNNRELADVLTYVRQSFGNDASSISSEEVKSVSKLPKKIGLYTVEELLRQHPLNN